jgi:hypothetical protein
MNGMNPDDYSGKIPGCTRLTLIQFLYFEI